jgi:hypothetical protein
MPSYKPGGDKRFYLEDHVIPFKSYLVALARADEIFGRGALCIAHRQSSSYYDALVEAANPAAVEPNQPYKAVALPSSCVATKVLTAGWFAIGFVDAQPCQSNGNACKTFAVFV